MIIRKTFKYKMYRQNVGLWKYTGDMRVFTIWFLFLPIYTWSEIIGLKRS